MVAGEDVRGGGQRVVAEVALSRLPARGPRRGAQGGVVGEHRVLRPDAGVEVGEDDALAREVTAADPLPDRRRADELRALDDGVGLVEGVGLHRDDAGQAQQRGGLVGRQADRQPAVDRRERGARAGTGHAAGQRPTEGGVDARGVGEVGLLGGGASTGESLARHAGAGGREPGQTAAVAREAVDVELDHDADQGRVGALEHGGVALGDLAGRRLGGTDGRGRRDSGGAQPRGAGPGCCRGGHGHEPGSGHGENGGTDDGTTRQDVHDGGSSRDPGPVPVGWRETMQGGDRMSMVWTDTYQGFPRLVG